MIEIETSRLLLRKFRSGDKEDMLEICSNEQFCLDDGGYHAYQAGEKFDELFQIFLEQDRYAIVLKEEDKVIGIINPMKADRAVPAYELGFGINPNYHRKGYGYEAVSSLISAWFAQTDTQMFLASHFPFNTASMKLIQKLGFIHEGTAHKAHGHALYGPTDLEYYYLEKQV